MWIYSSSSHLSFMSVSVGWEGAVLCCVCRPVKTREWRALAPERTSEHATTDRVWPKTLRFNLLRWKMVSVHFYISPLTYKTGHACSHTLIIVPLNARWCIVFLNVMCQNPLQGVWEVARFEGSGKKINKRGRTFFVHPTREITFQSGTQWQTNSLWVPMKVPASLQSKRKLKR